MNMKESDAVHPNAMEFEYSREDYVSINGIQMYYEYLNADPNPNIFPDRSAIVIIHGWTANRFRQHPLFILLSQKQYPVFRMDLRGHGWSQKGKNLNYYVQNHIEDIKKFIETVVIDRFRYKKIILIGHSMGGVIAQGIAISQPQYLDKLVLLATSPVFATNWFIRLGGIIFSMLWRFANDRMYHTKYANHVQLGLEHFPQWSDRYNKNGKTLFPEPKANYQEIRSLVNIDWRQDLSKIKVPTLIISGQLDKLAKPSMGKMIHELISGSKFVLLDECEHNMVIHRPIAVFNEVFHFISNNT
jgi:pimeloyl-ACP methyl ester carboxylesterase